MQLKFREARREDVASVVALLIDDTLGQGRELTDMAPYLAAFDRMQAEGGNTVIVGEDQTGAVVATYQLTLISGLSLSAARRAQVESVRIASHMRGHGLGHQMFADVEARARAAGCRLIQLTMNRTRTDSHRFYESLGFEASHIGFKLYLD
ncbi:aminoalkylphosphonic acid N-acetyltransferase [Roseovarius litorisediminis]|uniref:Aminoalkylphosphonic acid N-acetyltransferase n=1 Tax=Roseovarius litorisediminis TaxID=1312363 RepID=A0A1Y5R938_9RHOB|nr:GNAT family N-acetyltransferase [Roseovarius litorisediminis]SLN11640.1 aminoalkylphosphonic acid N-acetyltransferase [Roseovarius litorisediminis]